jgi:dimethylaniline monooxygenase (N-oxide forming)
MGSAPPLTKLLWTYGPKLTLIYCFGAAFPTFYRLLGPYRHPDAKQIVETEIYDTIRRRGIIGNLMMGLIPMIFYAVINLLALLAEQSLYIVEAIIHPFYLHSRSSSQSKPHGQNRRFQSDFDASPAVGPSSLKTETPTRRRGRMLRLFALLSALFAFSMPEAAANTEIRNFGPVLCRADEYGHLAAKAAHQLSENW